MSLYGKVRVRGDLYSGIFCVVIFTINIYILPINIFKRCRKLNILASVFGDTAHILGALKKVFTFNHLSEDADGDPESIIKVNKRNT